jgi:hypothetical protein
VEEPKYKSINVIRKKIKDYISSSGDDSSNGSSRSGRVEPTEVAVYVKNL